MARERCALCGVRDCLLRQGWMRWDEEEVDGVVALAGNPNTGKSTVFNALTGLRQHVGNWPGKTVMRAEGILEHRGRRFKLVDLPGTYSLFSLSTEEEIARDFLLFGRPHATVVVVDATNLERNLHLVMQILEVTHRVVVGLNLMDEARRKGLQVSPQQLERDLGVPVVPMAARRGEGLEQLVETVARVALGELIPRPRPLPLPPQVQRPLEELASFLEEALPGLPHARWIALRLLEGDGNMQEALNSGALRHWLSWLQGKEQEVVPLDGPDPVAQPVLERTEDLRRRIDGSLHDLLAQAIYAEAEAIARRAVRRRKEHPWDWEQRLDRILTSPLWAFPIMMALLMGVFWITIKGANYPSEMLARLFFWGEDQLGALFQFLGAPWWLTGFLVHGVYRGLAWVVSVMLPPMAIFFPLFTLLEDWGYLPRVAFNLDRLFRKVGAHGKQALTMSMGFGCNAAGVIATRIIDSPRERLIAILTNNFAPCNGRWPLLILMATAFIAAVFPPALGSVAAAASVMGVTLLGVGMTFLVSALLSRTLLQGEPSSFVLELPPYRPPQVLRVLYTSFIDRTLFVLGRAVAMAAPCGGLAWILGNLHVGGDSLMGHIAGFFDPLGRSIGLDGVILLAYIVAIPANEIVIPTMLMAYLNAGQMVEIESIAQLRHLLVHEHHWTLLTAVCLMLFSLLHNPCSTTIWTIYKETGSKKWTLIATFLPLSIAFALCFLVAQTARWLGWS